jgi:peptide-methionine (S)-S-oxide reductase
MILGNFLGGGAYNLKIDYSTLDHPGPELAQFAQEGTIPVESARDPHLKLATFAGGCFWGLELAFQRVPGVVQTAVGYTQGKEKCPNYDQVCAGATGHTEAVIVYYNPKECSYEILLDTFFARVDPTTVNGQGRDRGRQYRTGVYFHAPEQERIATARFQELQEQYHRIETSHSLLAGGKVPSTVFGKGRTVWKTSNGRKGSNGNHSMLWINK